MENILAPKDVDEHQPKKRRINAACDGCRKKKSDSAETQPDRCTNCRASNIKCTQDMPRQPKKSEAQAAYIANLEETIEKMRRLLRAVYAEKDLQLLLEKPLSELPGPASSAPARVPGHTSRSISRPTSTSTSTPTPSSMSGVKLPQMSSLSRELTHLALASSPPRRTSAHDNDNYGEATEAAEEEQEEEEEEDDPEDFAHLELAAHVNEFLSDMRAQEDRFFGRSSGFMFFKEAATVRGQLAGMPQASDSARYRRPMYWDVQPWELDPPILPSHPPVYEYPDDDLLRGLVFIFFEKFNPVLPLLHKPTFTKMLADGRHLYDQDFGMVVLMVCALASRYSLDPRVFSTSMGDVNSGDKGTGLSSGWRYFRQVPMYRRGLLYRTGLFDLQYYVLATMYLSGTSIPHNSWNLLGGVVRYLFELGGHRRKPQAQKPTAEDELMKRVFWCVLYIDRMEASFLGRPCLIQDEDYDIDFPIECDDEYWDPPSGNPDDAFKQPPGKPSYITAFVCSLKLVQILGLALRTLYSTKKAKALAGMVGPEWEQRVVAELDSALNKWKDSVPAFLQWDPEREDSTFFHQSVSIYATFHYVQIQIHRPFLMKKTPLSLPSLAMCTNAARSCARLLEASLTRGMRILPTLIVECFFPSFFFPPSIVFLPSFSQVLREILYMHLMAALIAASCSGTVIVLNLWGIRHSGLLGDAAKETVNLQKCINVLKECEKRWHIAGRSCDMLREIALLEDYDATAAPPKRRREELPRDARQVVLHHVDPSTTYAGPPQPPQSGSGANTTAYSVPNPPRSAAYDQHHDSSVSMSHSTASMSGVASFSPLVQAPLPMPMYNPAPDPLATDWDLGDLLMLWQTGYAQYGEPHASFDMGLQQGHVVSAPSSASASASPDGFGNTEDLLSLFSDVPMAFSLEEWDAYLANIGS